MSRGVRLDADLVFKVLREYSSLVCEVYVTQDHDGFGGTSLSRHELGDLLVREVCDLVPHYVRGQDDLQEPTLRLLDLYPDDVRLRRFWSSALYLWSRDPTWRYNMQVWFLLAWVASGNLWPVIGQVLRASLIKYRWQHALVVHTYDAKVVLRDNVQREDVLLTHMNLMLCPRGGVGQAKRDRAQERDKPRVVCVSRNCDTGGDLVFTLRRVLLCQ